MALSNVWHDVSIVSKQYAIEFIYKFKNVWPILYNTIIYFPLIKKKTSPAFGDPVINGNLSYNYKCYNY